MRFRPLQPCALQTLLGSGRGLVLRAAAVVLVGAAVGSITSEALPPVPFPPENPITEPKRVLGKVLFWDEQLSSTNTVACGTCHSPSHGGADPRIGINPGPDGSFNTDDDVIGSPGIARTGENGLPIDDPTYHFNPQVTSRSANSMIDSAYLTGAFWDGRASTTFRDPDTGSVAIAFGGALENQAIEPILSTVEMAAQARTWAQVSHKLSVSEPLAYAANLPPDIASVLSSRPSYSQLFQAAFGDDKITARRIAFAIATYERTLNSDQTPWDRFMAGDQSALTPGQRQGWDFFRATNCALCHQTPFFTNNQFRNTGVRPVAEDIGRQAVTGLTGDRGRFKVPSLRNVGLRATFFHNGRPVTMQEVMTQYAPVNPARSTDNLDPWVPVLLPADAEPLIIDFLQNGLTDPRVAAQQFPFDRPSLFAGAAEQISFDPDGITLRWPQLAGVTAYPVYRGLLSDLVDSDLDGLPDNGYGQCVSGSDQDTGDATFVDPSVPDSGEGYFYLRGFLDALLVRGLGTTSSGLPRPVPSACP